MPYRHLPGQRSELESPRFLALFDVFQLPSHFQHLASDRLSSGFAEAAPTLAETSRATEPRFDRHPAEDLVLDVNYSDALALDRSIARISQDRPQDLVFQIFLDEATQCIVETPAKRRGHPTDTAILAIDVDQPIRLFQPACQYVSFFAPRRHVPRLLHDPSILHAHVLSRQAPGVKLIQQRVTNLLATIPALSSVEVQRHLTSLLTLILSTYGETLGLHGNRRAMERAASFAKVRRFVHDNLEERNLTAEYVIESLNLSRPTIYRLFQHEGGLANYIQQLRLRTAARELVRLPTVPIEDIAYSVGFGSASAFTRAFRNTFDLAPSELRLRSRSSMEKRRSSERLSPSMSSLQAVR